LQNVLTQKLAELAKANEWINNLTLQQMMALDQEQAAAEKAAEDAAKNVPPVVTPPTDPNATPTGANG
jgi:hypothetical protein